MKNKPLLDRFFDRGISKEFGVPMNFADNVPKDQVQTFVLSPEVALSAEQLVRSKSFTMPKIEELHMPYTHTVVEYPLTPEIQKLRSNGLVDGTEPISRIGAYIHETGIGVFTCMPYWEFVDGKIQHSAFTFAFGLGDEVGGFKIFLGKNAQESVTAHLFPCVSFIKSAQKLGVKPEHLRNILKDEQVQQHIKESATEIPCLMFASFLLLNCKSGVVKTKIAEKRPPKGLKLGGKKKKQYSSSAYTVLHLEEIETISVEGIVSRREDISAHYVRGHFKQRKSGIYWWNSFIRGTGEVKKRKAYLVEETA